MLLKSKKNTSVTIKPKKARKPRAKKASKEILPEVETLLDKLNRNSLVSRLNATNTKLKEVGLLSSDDNSQDDFCLKLNGSNESNHSHESNVAMQMSLDSSREWSKPKDISLNEEEDTSISNLDLLSSTKNPSPANKNSRIRKKFFEVKVFNSIIDLDCWVRENNECSIVTTHSNNPNCNHCTSNDKEHKMSVIYRRCKCNKVDCSLTYKISKCQKGSNWVLFQNGIREKFNSFSLTSTYL
jgi:hypothetical protein